MFSEITEAMRNRMHELEVKDAVDRDDGTSRLERLRQIPPDTGKFIALTACGAPEGGEWIEIGTSAGYSAMWLSLAAKAKGTVLKTFEVLDTKAVLARETFEKASIVDYIDFVHGDFIKLHADIEKIAFCFLDCEKHLYEPCWDIVAEKMVPGGILVADNAINHYDSLKVMMHKADADPRYDCMTVTVGKGEFVCRRK